jgi:acetyltransferase
MKVIGPLHKTDVSGVVLNITDYTLADQTFDRLMKIPDARGVLLQPMVRGTELFMGAKYEDKFGHLILFGLGGILVEVFRDVATGLAPLHPDSIRRMIQSLKGYPLLRGIRGGRGVDVEKFAELVHRLCALLNTAPRIQEMDINPLIGNGAAIQAVDARIRIGK